MEPAPLLRSRVVGKGVLHTRVHAALVAAYKRGVFTQESLAGAVGKKQTTIGQYLLGKKAGTLDLDEADAALRHADYDGLGAFMAGQSPVPLSRAELLARRLEGREDVIDLVEALLVVPRKRLAVVAGQIDAGVYAATGRRLVRSAEYGDGTILAAGTTKGPKKRR